MEEKEKLESIRLLLQEEELKSKPFASFLIASSRRNSNASDSGSQINSEKGTNSDDGLDSNENKSLYPEKGSRLSATERARQNLQYYLPDSSASLRETFKLKESATHTTAKIQFKYSSNKHVLSVCISTLNNLALPDYGGPHYIRFTVKATSSNIKKKKFKPRKLSNDYCSIDHKDVLPAKFVFTSYSNELINFTTIRIKLYGKRMRVKRLTVLEHCLGEAYIHLEDFDLSESDVCITRSILPISEKM